MSTSDPLNPRINRTSAFPTTATGTLPRIEPTPTPAHASANFSSPGYHNAPRQYAPGVHVGRPDSLGRR